MKKSSLLLTLSLGAVLGLFSCDSQSLVQVSKGIYVFDTLVQITTYHGEEETIDEIFDLLYRLDDLFDPYNEPPSGVTSVYSLNNAEGPLEIDPLLFEALEKAEEGKELTGGLFDPLIGKVTSLYKDAFYPESAGDSDFVPALPDMDLVASYLQEAQGSRLILDSATMSAEIEGGAAIDLGGIAKGFALDKTIEILERYGIEDYMIQFSASSIGLGNNPKRAEDGGIFNVAINTYGGPSRSFKAKDVCFSTSAIYEQAVTIGGKTYSHMVNPKTGSAISENDLAVVRGGKADNAILDATSTAVCLTPAAELSALEDNLSEHGYDFSFFVMKDYEDVYRSADFDVQGSTLP